MKAEGILLKSDLYDKEMKNVVDIKTFCNVLQLHFFYSIAIKLNLSYDIRMLSPPDFDYFKINYFRNNTMINIEEYDSFWENYGAHISLLRKEKHFVKLWQKGLIYGFISRQDTHNILNNLNAGTFTIRFSDRNPGSIVVVYKSIDDDKVKNDILTNEYNEKTTLSDYLCNNDKYKGLLFVLEFKYDTETERILYSPKAKTDSLKDFLTNNQKDSLKGEYDNMEGPRIGLEYNKKRCLGKRRRNISKDLDK